MPEISINDIILEGKVGETLEQIARRAGVVIGINCNGTGYHVLCEFKILEGGEYLSPASPEEQKWLADSIAGDGHRLGCQASILDKSGNIKVLTLSESVRRQFLSPLPVGGTASTNNGANLVQIALSHVMAAPLGLIHTAKNSNNLSLKPTLEALGDLIKSGNLIVENFLNRK